MNVLFIMTDQLRKDALGCYGNSITDTRNIDDLANNGIKFENCFTQASVCSPSRATIATGRYPQSHGLSFNGINLPKSEKTIMHYLLEQGYETAAFGKVHFETRHQSMELDNTFSDILRIPHEKNLKDYYGFKNFKLSEEDGLSDYSDYLTANGFTWNEDLITSLEDKNKITYLSAFPEEYYNTTWVADETIKCIKDKKDKDFFIFCSFTDPHDPFCAPEPYYSMYNPIDMPLPIKNKNELDNKPNFLKNYFNNLDDYFLDFSNFSDYDWKKIKAVYYGKISLIDKNVGRLINSLKENNLFEDTMIIFTSDHGEALGDNYTINKGPFHYDHVINIPLIIKYPKEIKNQKVDSLCQLTDLVPTILETAGIEVPSRIQGKSLLPLLNSSNEDLYEEIYTEWYEDPKVFTIRSRYWRYSYWLNDSSEELYDLKNDPFQFKNLSNISKYQKYKDLLKEKLLHRIIENRDPLPERKVIW